MNKNQVVFVLGLIIVFFIVVIIANNQDSFKPGDVVYSILDPERFAEQHGDDWVLLDGRELSGCKLYSITELDTIPNAQGVFIRAMDTRDKNRKDTIRTVGSYQDDAFQGHCHHVKTKAYGTGGGKDENYPDGQGELSGPPIDDGHGVPRVSTETRPKNITLYVYIKID